uniref:Ubiquitin-like protease family profile domain-containing protein n=1 Tax=Chenopodium quinoa TaxID=63459 RepID=A0A803MEV2_CHEQI
MRKAVVQSNGWKKGLVDRIVKGKGRLEESEDDEDYQEGYEEVEEDDYDDYDYEEEGQSVSSSGDFMANMMMEYMKMKSRKRKGKVEQSVYQKQKYPNIVCRVESFCDSVKLFDLRRKQLVKQMGFGGFLELDMKNIPRQFCYWLMARVLEDGTMVFGEGEILPLCATQVRVVLGIPMGTRPVPLDIGEDEDRIMLVKGLYDSYGVGPKKETISLKKASEVLCPVDSENHPFPLLTESDEEEFMIEFLIVVLGKLLCTTKNSSNLASSLIPCLTVAITASEYDWSGSGGSFLFVMIFYLDHLHRRPLQWSVFPRVKIWNSAQIKAALMEDKISPDEYGKLLALDIAYGEEHPLDPRDDECMRGAVSAGTQLDKVDNVVVEVMGKVIEKLTLRLETFVEGVVGKAFSVFVSKMCNMGSYNATDDFCSTHSQLATGSTGPLPQNVGPVEKIVGGVLTGDNILQPTVEAAEEEPMPCKLTVLEKRLVNFVRGWKEMKNENAPGPSIIECDGMDASQRDCYRVLSPRCRVGDQYVRMASVLYMKTWSDHTMKRILLDPSYSMRKKFNFMHFVIQGKDELKDLGQKYDKVFLSFELMQIESVFVPVLDTAQKDAEHWYCLALDLKGRQIWMIDSLYDDAYSRHEKIVTKLIMIEALGVLLNISDPNWEQGTISTWVRKCFPVTQTDTCSCGAIMLAAIKHCVRSFDAAFHMEKISTLRQNLFLNDVNSDYNQL